MAAPRKQSAEVLRERGLEVVGTLLDKHPDGWFASREEAL